MNYKNKYLKYKSKYLAAKNLVGGCQPPDGQDEPVTPVPLKTRSQISREIREAVRRVQIQAEAAARRAQIQAEAAIVAAVAAEEYAARAEEYAAQAELLVGVGETSDEEEEEEDEEEDEPRTTGKPPQGFRRGYWGKGQ